MHGRCGRKDRDEWETEVTYSPEDNNQIYIRPVSVFFSKFVPRNCWETATDEQRQKMKERKSDVLR